MLKTLVNQNFYKALESYEGSKIPRDDWKRMRDLAIRGAKVLLGDYSQLTAADKKDYVEPWGSIKFYFGDRLETEYICQREAGKQLFNHLWSAGTQENMGLSTIAAATSSITAATQAIGDLAEATSAASKAITNTTTTTIPNLWADVGSSIHIEQPAYKSEVNPIKEKVDKCAKELKALSDVALERIESLETTAYGTTPTEIHEIQKRVDQLEYAKAELEDKLCWVDERERTAANSVDFHINEEHEALNETIELLKKRVEQLGHDLEVHLAPVNDLKCAEENKEDIMNTNSMFNFDFGRVTDSVRVSTYGLAIKGVDGRYVSWDNKNKSVMDVEVLSMPGSEFVYKMPVAIKDVKVGDVVVHNRVPMYVTAVNAQTLTVVDIREATEKTIYPVKSPFGFNFVTKVVSLFDSVNGTASADAPFGNMLPFMLMGNKDMDPMMLMMMMNQGGNANIMSNPMMMYFLMKDGKGSDMLPFVMMGMMNQPVSTPVTAPQTQPE